MFRAKVISILGGPGAGKSTLSARIFSELKMKSVSVELVTEWIKDRIWEENKEALSNQLYIFASQYYKLSRVADKVDVIVCDGALITEPLYNNYPEPMRGHLNTLVRDVSNQFQNMYYLVKRTVPYELHGRLHTEEESDNCYYQLKEFMGKEHIPYKEISGDEEGVRQIVLDYLSKS